MEWWVRENWEVRSSAGEEEKEEEEVEGDDDENSEDENADAADDADEPAKDGIKGKVFSKEDFERMKSEKKSRGVLYLSRIPFRMNYTEMREYFSHFGQVTQIYLKERNKNSALQNKDQQQKKKKSKFTKQYNEGWIEFADKSIAKRVAYSLNNQSFGGSDPKRRNFLWNIQYLHKFDW